MVYENEVEGFAQELGGKVEEAIGGVTGDAKTQAEGKWDQAIGRAQRSFGAAAEEVRDNVVEQPLTALAIVAGVAFLLGFLARK